LRQPSGVGRQALDFGADFDVKLVDKAWKA
jgi:hypothetical protein